MEPDIVSKQPIAIVGLGCVLPDAPDVETFWNNLLEGKNSVREVPPGRWDPALYWSADKSLPDKTYTKIGAFVADDGFQGLDFRMPPNTVAQVDPCQRWALSSARQALQDAGLKTGLRGDEGRDFDRDRCAVIIGNAMGGELQKHQHKRLVWAEARAAIEAQPEFQALEAEARNSILRNAEEAYKADTNPVTEDTMPGHLSNVIAGRVANVFDLGGKNFTTDAACASSLAALDAAVDALRDDEADYVVWGGTDRSMDVSAYIQFSKIGALSPDGSRPFDKDANGFVMGEGCAMFVLKRLSDAERDGDKVYAVIRSVGGSSDGKGKGITAPNPAGQVKAVVRAYEEAEFDPATLGYLEAHGTSTPVGDPVELESVVKAVGQTAASPPPAGSMLVGSVKSNIGHLKAGAGAAGMLKAVLACHHGVVPPSINVTELNPRIDWEHSPFRVATEKTEWPQPADHPRRAALSSFGFGGTNFHVVLEQYLPGALKYIDPRSVVQAVPDAASTSAAATRTEFDQKAFAKAMADGAAALEGTAVVLTPDDAPKLIAQPDPSYAEDGKGPRLRDVLHPFTATGIHADQRVAFHLDKPSDAAKKLEMAQKAMANPAAAKLAYNQGIFLGEGSPKGKVAFLFPGQGTQYVNMGRDLAAKYRVVMDTFVEADRHLRDELGEDLTDILWPTPDTPENRKASEEKLTLTEYTQPAVLAMDVAILRLLRHLGIDADVVAGHSLGEYGALVAAGVLSFGDALHAVAARGREMAHVEVPDLGKMVSVSADWEQVQEVLDDVDGYVICANKNCPSQTVIAGSTEGVEQAVAALGEKGLQTMYLPVSAAFHSDIVAPASKPLRKVLGRLDVQSPKIRCLTNVGAQPYPDDPEAIRDNLAVQVASAVEWIGIIERMYDEGVRTFIEVGPKRALTGFVADILGDKADIRPIFANHPKKGGIATLNELFAFLGAHGFKPTLPALDDAEVYSSRFLHPRQAFTREVSVAAAPPSAPAAPAAEDPRLGLIADKLTQLTQELDALRGKQPAGISATTPAAVQAPVQIGISGISVGLPGQHKPFFSPDNWDRILAGENLIDVLDQDDRRAMVDKGITRLVKSAGGQGTFEAIDDPEQVIKLAGRRGSFDLSEWGVAEELTEVLDVTSQYAIAAGLEALQDAGIPLQRVYRETTTGSRLPQGWALPPSIGDETGVIFASAFPGYDALLENVKAEGKQAAFNRKFLFHVLSMGHSQVAQFLGARGPNTQVNAACASTTQAISIAEDWIKAGRCKRVLVLGADDATSPNMMEWIGSGFLASGAATTEEDVTQAALPFDARRHGMIIGMGAVGLVIEAEEETEARGMRPIARLLASEVCNSAYHGSRLDIDHIAKTMQKLVGKAVGSKDLAAIAGQTVFMSHETYTPARGGSAAAEIHALRAAFGDAANKVVIANTKGFTGHPQGAGIEDAVVLKALQRGVIPPIPNLQQPDPELGDLNLSKGGEYSVRYALRLAAGFGSQVAMTFTELVARENERVADEARYQAWLAAVTGIEGATTEVVDRTLRIVDSGAPQRPAPGPVEEPAAVQAAEPAPLASADVDDVLQRVTGVVADKTGYPLELLEADLDLEADLGIDTVKQAELFGELREMFGVPLDESLQLKDYNTLRKVAQYMGGGQAPAAQPPAADADQATAQETVAEPAAAPITADAPAPATETLDKVTAVIADKTGYPIEMLEPDLDLEADLGIDTVKQAELFGELREMFGVPLDEELQLKDYNTLSKVAAYMGGGTPEASPAAAASVPAAEEPIPDDAPASTAGATDEALAKVTQVIADKTGYPIEMLEPDLDLEADLGIDTVKQAELFGELREMFGVPLDEELQLKDYNTLSKVAAYMGGGAPDAGPAAAATVPAAEGPATDEASVPASGGEVRRLVPVLRPESLPNEPNDIPRGPLAVVGNVPQDVRAAWEAAGFTFDGDDAVGLLVWGDGDTDALVPELFETAKAHAATLRSACIVTAQDGAHGLHAPRDPAMAALAGEGKALRKELDGATVKVIDLHPDGLDPGDRCLNELLQGGPRTEVCYGADGTRYVVDVAPRELPDAVPDLSGKTLVVSGGAQGITAELLASVATAGTQFLLLGRTPLPEEASTWATWDDDAWKAEESRTIEAIREEGGRPTPVEVRKRVDKKRKAVEVQQTLERLQGDGAQALYAAVDVTDADSVKGAVDWAREHFGRIDGIVHAAGVEISKMLADKPREQFDLVYNIKVAGLRNLLAATADDPLSILAGFGSVAGRFGNVGQIDYSAANDAMAKLIAQTADERDIETAFTIAWGPWGEIGMATRGGIMTVLRESGVTPIPTADGIAAWQRELAAPGIRECVVAGDLGMLDVDGQIVDKAWDPAIAEAASWLQTAPERFRLLHDVVAYTPGKHVTATISLDRSVDPYLDDHAIDDVPLLPGVFGIEAFAQAARLVAPEDQELIGARDVRFLSPFKQHKGPVEASVIADIDSVGDETRIACRLESQFRGPDGKALGEPRVHFEATILYGAAPEPLRTADVPSSDATYERDRIYPPFFHGPSFQVLDMAGPFEEGEGIAHWQRPEAPCFGAGDAEFLSHPLISEGMFQACGLRTIHTDRVMSLPAGIEKLDIFAAGTDPAKARIWCRYGGKDRDGRRRFDAAACTPDGTVLVRMVGYSMVEVGPMEIPAAASKADDAPQQVTLTTPEAAEAEEADAAQGTPSVDVGAIPMPVIDGVLFAATAVAESTPDHRDLTPDEQSQAAAFPAPKRMAEWVAGRRAAKAATILAAPDLAATDITVDNDEDGAPHLIIRGEPSPARLSITHRDGIAIAAVADGELGIDLETPEPRAESWWEQAFSQAEAAALRALPEPDLAATAAWAAKESVLKRHGKGLQVPLHDVHVEFGENGASVTGPFGTFAVRFYDLAGRVLAVSLPAFDTAQVPAQR